MFNSTVLEVVIGLVFLYLSLSLACSALNEYYSALMSRRAAHLRDSLSSLFNKDDPKGLAFLLDFYNHPMISGLAPTRRRPDASSRRDVSMGLPSRQKLVVVPARLAADGLRWLLGAIGAVLGSLRWVLDALRDPYGAGGVLSGLRKELATAARATPTYIPDRVFSDAIFAVLASDAGASRRLMVELHEQLSGSDAAFRALPDPETAKALVANLEKASRMLRAQADESTAPEAIMASASSAFGGLLDGLEADDPSTAPALALLDARIAAPDSAPAPAPAGGASTAASARSRIEGLRKGLVADAGALPDGSSKRVLIRLAGRAAWFAGLRTPPEPRAYLANLKEALVARDKLRAESLRVAREHAAKALEAVLAVGPKLPDEALVRDHVWEALRASLGHLGAAVATLPEGPPRDALVAVVAGASGGIAARRAEEPMTLGRAKDAAKDAFGSIRGTLEGLVDEADRAKVSAWVAREEGLLAASEGDLLTLAKLRDAVAALPECDVRVALLTLMDEVGDDLDRVKRNIQVWYNDTMERVSGRYKRTTQVLLTIIALGLVAALNADTIRIAQRLWGDPSLRVKIEAEADLATKAMAEAPPPPKAPVAAPPGDGEDPLPPDPRLAIDRLLEQSGLPLGWTQAELRRLGIGREALLGRRTVDPSGATEYGRWAREAAGLLAEKLLGTPEGLSKLIGLALTAVAVSMGAPFWFDVLNKVVNVRTAGLRPPKSADEPPAAPSGR